MHVMIKTLCSILVEIMPLGDKDKMCSKIRISKKGLDTLENIAKVEIII